MPRGLDCGPRTVPRRLECGPLKVLRGLGCCPRRVSGIGMALRGLGARNQSLLFMGIIQGSNFHTEVTNAVNNNNLSRRGERI